MDHDDAVMLFAVFALLLAMVVVSLVLVGGVF